ncbi:MAG: STAS domain-containing protein [SAR324 cluster bacterium]|nr:STAS domain-containing protein [SAR324 cluster bacterium]
MKLSHRTKNNICIVSIGEKVLQENTEELGNYIFDLLQTKKPRGILINLGKAVELDSSGIGIIVSFFKTAQKEQIGFAVCRLTGLVAKAFKVTLLDRILPVYEKETEALKALGCIE